VKLEETLQLIWPEEAVVALPLNRGLPLTLMVSLVCHQYSLQREVAVAGSL